MMGDREKCIQAQMDEYLSKPLQQNHLIQTILKCATLGGVLLEKNREHDLTGKPEDADIKRQTDAAASKLRPPMPDRAATTAESLSGDGAQSPAIVAASLEDPIQRARSSLSEPV